MTRRKPFNRQLVQSNISEAIEQLQKLERNAANGTLEEGELYVGLQHAYHHLNFCWHVRRISTSEYKKLTNAQFNEWGAYPSEIEQMTVSD